MLDKKEDRMQSIIAKAEADGDFRARLLEDPAAALKAEGIDLPPDITLVFHENTAQACHFVLPEKPSNEMSDAELQGVAGAANPKKRLPLKHFSEPY